MPQNSLEQEAFQRVQRMYMGAENQRRGGQNRTRREPRPDPPKTDPPPPPPREDPPDGKPPVELPELPQKPEINLLDTLFEDGEKSLIMLLIIILMNDGADMSTLLALMYLII